MGKRVDYRRVKTHWTLTPQEWVSRLGVSKNTILRWIRVDGLEAITDQRPYLIRGVDLKNFLEARKSKRRFNCKTGEMVCFACRKERQPAEGMLDYKSQNRSSGLLTGLCSTCLTTMNRMIREVDIEKKFPDCSVTETRCKGTLSGSTRHPMNDHLSGASAAPQKTTRKSQDKAEKG